MTQTQTARPPSPAAPSTNLYVIDHLIDLYVLPFRFGYCGKGKGFCFPAEKPKPDEAPESSGCLLENTEIIGGDLPQSAGGGGVRLDIDSPDQCSAR